MHGHPARNTKVVNFNFSHVTFDVKHQEAPGGPASSKSCPSTTHPCSQSCPTACLHLSRRLRISVRRSVSVRASQLQALLYSLPCWVQEYQSLRRVAMSTEMEERTHRKSSSNSFRSGKNNLGSRTANNASAALNKNESPSNNRTSHTCAQVLISRWSRNSGTSQSGR